jgi:hypothetical protein
MVLALILAIAAAAADGALADVLLIEEVRQADRMDLPSNGQTMEEVEARFGAPGKKHAAVGDPPITRWEYERWSVYFEYSRVLFTALHKGEVIEKD